MFRKLLKRLRPTNPGSLPCFAWSEDALRTALLVEKESLRDCLMDTADGEDRVEAALDAVDRVAACLHGSDASPSEIQDVFRAGAHLVLGLFDHPVELPNKKARLKMCQKHPTPSNWLRGLWLALLSQDESVIEALSCLPARGFHVAAPFESVCYASANALRAHLNGKANATDFLRMARDRVEDADADEATPTNELATLEQTLALIQAVLDQDPRALHEATCAALKDHLDKYLGHEHEHPSALLAIHASGLLMLARRSEVEAPFSHPQLVDW